MPLDISPEAKEVISLMLQTDPYKRISVKQLLHHRWLKPINLTEISDNSLDELALWKCHLLFDEIPLRQLKHNITKTCGYHSASYWLLKANNDEERKVSSNVANLFL